VFSQKYEKMIKNVYFISDLLPDLAKIPKDDHNFLVDLPMYDCHFGCKPKFLGINTGSGPYSSDALILSKAPYTTSNQ
jgi:hypothetical protein